MITGECALPSPSGSLSRLSWPSAAIRHPHSPPPHHVLCGRSWVPATWRCGAALDSGNMTATLGTTKGRLQAVNDARRLLGSKPPEQRHVNEQCQDQKPDHQHEPPAHLHCNGNPLAEHPCRAEALSQTPWKPTIRVINVSRRYRQLHLLAQKKMAPGVCRRFPLDGPTADLPAHFITPESCQV